MEYKISETVVCDRFCEEVANVLGLDWSLLFLQAHVHPSTVVWGLRILVVLGSVPSLLTKFREGTSNGGWLHDTELVLHNKLGVVLGNNAFTTLLLLLIITVNVQS